MRQKSTVSGYLIVNAQIRPLWSAYKGRWAQVAQSYLTQRPHGLHGPRNSPGQNTGVGSCSLLQGTFPNQGPTSGLPHCRRILYQLSHQGSPKRPAMWDKFRKRWRALNVREMGSNLIQELGTKGCGTKPRYFPGAQGTGESCHSSVTVWELRMPISHFPWARSQEEDRGQAMASIPHSASGHWTGTQLTLSKHK